MTISSRQCWKGIIGENMTCFPYHCISPVKKGASSNRPMFIAQLLGILSAISIPLVARSRNNRVAEQVLRAPLGHLRNDGQQTLAYSSQGVLHLWRHDLVFGPLDETQRRQGLQLPAEHARRNLRAAADVA